MVCWDDDFSHAVFRALASKCQMREVVAKISSRFQCTAYQLRVSFDSCNLTTVGQRQDGPAMGGFMCVVVQIANVVVRMNFLNGNVLLFNASRMGHLKELISNEAGGKIVRLPTFHLLGPRFPIPNYFQNT